MTARWLSARWNAFVASAVRKPNNPSALPGWKPIVRSVSCQAATSGPEQTRRRRRGEVGTMSGM